MKQILSFLLLFCSFNTFAQTLEADRLALIAVYNAMGGTGWYSERDEPWPLPSQPGASPCGWYGVTCENGRVVVLNLSGNDFSGQIPPEIGNLTALRDLYLSWSEGLNPRSPLTGEIPAEFANLVSLETLDLSNNNLDPDGLDVLWTLPRLKVLSISPAGPISESIGNATTLESLTMLHAGNITSPDLGNLPVSISNLTLLKTLVISNCGFTGTLPASIGNLGNLTKLEITDTGLSGNIPGGIGNLVNLKSLSLSGKGLTGPIPSQIGNLTGLTSLSITGLKAGGNIPTELGNLSNLETLTLANNELNGNLPASINNLSKAWLMDLSGNNLSGAIPNIANIKINRLQIAGNKFTFDGMETNFSRLSVNIPQQKIGVSKTNRTLSVYAGGTLANNTYRWYRFGELIATKVGDSTYLAPQEGNYHVTVTNSIVTTLTLTSEIYSMTLPVTLVFFEAKSESNQTQLTWKTTAETNNKGFEIERSADARTFERIGFVDGSGDTQENQFYHFTDLNPLVMGYYRLKQLDYDGKFEFSKTIAVKAAKEPIRIYPNPAQTELTVAGARGNEQVSIITSTGRPVISNANLSVGKLDVKDLKEGIYTIKIGDVSKKLLIKR
ncbi:leucine-rich repeat domain-containing protein [Dyadobacter sp. OTU695]|uniref:leucine-rich repeat domain-containing protein n=1 Tax=Dyadobacter sp. OTU695 TaxID=3043860 RepID=UPI00313C8948